MVEEHKMTASKNMRLARKILSMPKELSNTPPGYDWGWYSREDPRMHLQSVDEKHRNDHKVWLETRGRRSFEPALKIPGNVLKPLRAAVARRRQRIEDDWVSFMIRQGWLEAHLAAPQVTLVAYPDTPNGFTRTVDLTEHLMEEEAMNLRDSDIRLSPEMASLQIWPGKLPNQRQDIRLSTILWQD
jgi:hypothetical protein